MAMNNAEEKKVAAKLPVRPALQLMAGHKNRGSTQAADRARLNQKSVHHVIIGADRLLGHRSYVANPNYGDIPTLPGVIVKEASDEHLIANANSPLFYNLIGCKDCI